MSDRPDWNYIYMKMCQDLALRSTCLRIQTSAIIVKDQNIISIGYNGASAGNLHCCDHWKQEYERKYTGKFTNDGSIWENYTDDKLKFTFEDYLKTPEFYTAHHEWSNCNEVHGEMNAILHASKSGKSTNDSILYTLYSPCIHCSKSILTCGIKEVYYKKIYHRDILGVQFLEQRNIPCYQFGADAEKNNTHNDNIEYNDIKNIADKLFTLSIE